MTRTDLHVPFEQKEEAKIFGARWDPEKRCWWTDARNLEPFARWLTPQELKPDPMVPQVLPEPNFPNVRAPGFAIITGATDCWKCHASTQVSALVLSVYEEQDGDEGDWERGADRMMLQRISAMNVPAREQVRALAPWMKPGFSRTADAVYLANHCAHCDALQGEWFLAEPGAVFFPSDGTLPDYETTVVDVPLEAEAGGSVSSWLDELYCSSPRVPHIESYQRIPDGNQPVVQRHAREPTTCADSDASSSKQKETTRSIQGCGCTSIPSQDASADQQGSSMVSGFHAGCVGYRRSILAAHEAGETGAHEHYGRPTPVDRLHSRAKL